MRYGFAVKVLGDGGLPSHDTRKWQNEPDLGVSIRMLYDILDYLKRKNIRMYRISSDFVPYGTHPDMPQFHGQIDRYRKELAELGSQAEKHDIRLSLHPSQYVVLNAEDEAVAKKAAADLMQQAELLDAMEQGPEAVVVTHVGGEYKNKDSSIARFITRWHLLGEPARRRMVVENDEKLFTVDDTLKIHESTGSRLVFDYQHYMLNPGKRSMKDALRACIATWPDGVMSKIHFSSPRTELRELQRKSPLTGKKESVYQPPLLSQHADYINPLEFLLFADAVGGLSFDVMLEAKAKDLALLELRRFFRMRGREDLVDIPIYT